MNDQQRSVTPAEAAAALRDVDYRQQQVSAATATQPRWLYPAMGALLALQGMAADQWPGQGWTSQPGVWAVLLIGLGRYVPALGAGLGFPAGSHWGRGSRSRLRSLVRMVDLITAVALLALWWLLQLLVQHWNVRYPHTIVGVGLGLLLALAVPFIRRRTILAFSQGNRDVD